MKMKFSSDFQVFIKFHEYNENLETYIGTIE